MQLPFTPNHIHLISACYPPSAALSAAGQQYLPNSQELSRLTYYASNRPGKISKLSHELEKRVRNDCRKAQAGNTRARATLLIALYIFKALATECRRDLALLTPSLMSAVKVALSTLSSDLEVAARAATVFTTWTTYTDGNLIGVDNGVTQDYISCLQHFSIMGAIKHQDAETQNRTRLVGLAALAAAVNSEALFHQRDQFKAQVSIIMPALLRSLIDVDVPLLDNEANEMKDQPKRFPVLDEFRTRPTMERRAASIHLHVDGDKGPPAADVTNAALQTLSSLLGHSTGIQVNHIITATVEYLDDAREWDKVDNCKWVATKAAEWTQYQYRYAVPTRLVECLLEGQETASATSRHKTLLTMIAAVFNSPVPLVNLSTSDIISNLISFLFKRISADPDDVLLSAAVQCIASLGTHVYYADQIQDLAAELISRLVLVETGGIPGQRRPEAEKGRVPAVRCLLAGLLGLIHAADIHQTPDGEEAQDKREIRTTGTSPELTVSSPSRDVHLRPSRRTKVPPEVWHDTLILLCDKEFPVRADYSVALVSYLQREIPRLSEQTDSDGVKRIRPLLSGPTEQSHTMTAMIYGDPATRFLHAIHAYLYAVATSPALGFLSRSSSSSPERKSSSNPQFEGDENGGRESPHSRNNSRPSTNMTSRTRKTSVILRVMQDIPSRLSSTPPATTLSDYSDILAVLTAVHENVPIRGLLTGVPMLLALERATHAVEGGDSPNAAAVQVIRQVAARTWLAIGNVWGCAEVVELVKQYMSSAEQAVTLPPFSEHDPGSLSSSPALVPLPNDTPSSVTLDPLNSEALLQSLVSSPNLQEALGMGQEGLLRRLSSPWSPELAFRQSFEAKTDYDATVHDGLAPLIKVAPALMHIENLSLQSLARSTRGTGVTDLRDALEGRSSLSNPNLPNNAPSISTFDHTSSVLPSEVHHMLTPTRSRGVARSKLAGPGEVRDVLNKLGIGKQQVGTGNMKSSFPALQPQQSRTSQFSPPYKK